MNSAMIKIYSCLLIIMFGAMAYSSSLNAPFYLDDYDNIINNIDIKITIMNMKSLANVSAKSHIPTRPVAYISFAINHYFNNDSVVPYHIVNIAIHLLSGIFLYLVLLNTLNMFSENYNEEDKYLIAFFGALLWLLHPLHTQSVTYIVQRMNSMSAMFFLVSLYAYIEARKISNRKYKILLFTASVLSWLLALGSKENAITLPMFILLYEWFFFQNRSWQWIKKQLPFLLLGVFLGLTLVFVYLGSNPLDAIQHAYGGRNFTMVERVLTQPRVVFYYLGFLVFPLPSRLSLEHDFLISKSLIDPITTLFSISGILVLVVIGLLSSKNHRILSYAILWFIGNLVLESSVIGLEIIFEHRTYLPTMMLFVLLPMIILAVFRSRKISVSILVLVSIFFAVFTCQRNAVWNNPDQFWQGMVRAAPNNFRVFNNYSDYLYSNGRYGKSITAAKQALKLSPDSVVPFINIGNSYSAQGNIYKAIETFEQVIRQHPRYVRALVNLGSMYGRLGMSSAAINMFERALQASKKKIPGVYFNLGLAYQEQGYNKKALVAFQKELEMNPADREARMKISELIKKIE